MHWGLLFVLEIYSWQYKGCASWHWGCAELVWQNALYASSSVNQSEHLNWTWATHCLLSLQDNFCNYFCGKSVHFSLWHSEWDSEEIKLHKLRDILVKFLRIEELWPCDWTESLQSKFAYNSVFFALQNKNQKQKSNMQVKENLGHMHKDLPWSSVITKFLEP